MQLGLGKFQLKVPSWLVPILGYAISIASLIWVVKGVNFHDVLHDFRSLHWGWVAVAVVSDILVYVVQAWRWNVLLGPVVRAPLLRSVQAIYVGLFANEVLPLRPGEVIRSYLQARWSKIPFSVAFASALIERVFDGIWLVALFFLTTRSLKVQLPAVVMDIARAVGLLVGVLTFGLCLVMFQKQHAHAACPEGKWGERMRVLIDDLHLMGRSKSFYFALAGSLPCLLVQVIPVYSLIRAYGLELRLWPAFVVLIVLRIGTVIPQAPGNMGAAQALMVVTLARFGVKKRIATGLSLTTWAVITLPLLVAGGVALALTGLNLSEIRRRARGHSPTPPTVPEPQPTKSA